MKKVYILDARLMKGRFSMWQRKMTFPTLQEAEKAKKLIEGENKNIGTFECWVTIEESEYYDSVVDIIDPRIDGKLNKSSES